MNTHEIITTCRTRRRGILRRGVTEQVVITEVEAHTAEELGRITRAVLTAIDDALPHGQQPPERPSACQQPGRPEPTRREDSPVDEIERRTAAALHAEEEGDYRRAARLYQQLGRDIQARHGRFDPRALDAFEGVARSIRKSTS